MSTSLTADWTLVVAVARNGVIGRADALPWKLRSDLQRFKRMTMGHCLLMGRKTYDSIGRPLPGRQTIVLSRNAVQSSQSSPSKISDPIYVRELSDVAHCVEPGRRVMVVGGAEVYRATLGYCSTIWLTRVLADVEGDTFFPELDWEQWQLDSSEFMEAGEHDQWPTEFQVWHRKANG